MMFVESNVKRGDRYFRQMLQAYSDELTGSIQSAMSQFSRPGVNLVNKRALHRIGPIGHGWRCTVGEARTAYSSQIYKKGALVLHMLRIMLRAMTGSDDTFFQVMSTFAQRFADEYATTADFEAVLNELHPGDWSWFFDQWVFGAEFRQGPDGTVLAFVDPPAQDFEFPLSQRPSKIIFNPDNAVLARVKKK